MKRDEGTAQTEVPFSHNHSHDLESLGWVVVWVVFYNNLSEEMPSYDHLPFTLQDALGQLKLAGILFPPMLDSTRRDGYQLRKFRNICDQLPLNKKPIYDRLNLLLRLLISHCIVIEVEYHFPSTRTSPRMIFTTISHEFSRF